MAQEDVKSMNVEMQTALYSETPSQRQNESFTESRMWLGVLPAQQRHGEVSEHSVALHGALYMDIETAL